MSHVQSSSAQSVLKDLHELAYNLWWSWDSEASALWAEIDPFRWERDRHNPITLIRDVEPERWEELAADKEYVARVSSVTRRFREYMKASSWSPAGSPRIAYYSMEFGLHESMRLYSGGLGVLAGDHLRSASDLGVRLTGVSLLYRQGYFRQIIDGTGQLAVYTDADFDRLPIRPVQGDDGEPLTVTVPVAGKNVVARIWRMNVGRCKLFLLDTGCELTHQLYGGDGWMRIRQEVLLGLGGVRALRALGRRVDVHHLNEGHCAFAVLQLAADELASGASWEKALKRVKRRCVFTTHTPVAAGHDRFYWERVDKALGDWRDSLGLPTGTFMNMGRVDPGNLGENLCMTVIALKHSSKANGVSALHGEVSRRMWSRLQVKAPIGHVTNGVHPVFWSSVHTRRFFDERAPGWREHPWEPEIWKAIASTSDEEIQEWRRQNRALLIAELKRRTGIQLDPERLTMGFARRFAPYKRGDLLFRDPARLKAILGDHAQVVFAGKAHPADGHGKHILEQIIRWSHHRDFRGRVVFLEDYNIALGRAMTSGADVWLNTPRRPREASGTSGQKVILNGGLNLSILDGWWPEGFDGTNGWSIDDGRDWDDTGAQDAHDAERLYSILEEDVLPAFGTASWSERVRRSVVTCAPLFTSHRMVRDYALELYGPVGGA